MGGAGARTSELWPCAERTLGHRPGRKAQGGGSSQSLETRAGSPIAPFFPIVGPETPKQKYLAGNPHLVLERAALWGPPAWSPGGGALETPVRSRSPPGHEAIKGARAPPGGRGAGHLSGGTGTPGDPAAARGSLHPRGLGGREEVDAWGQEPFVFGIVQSTGPGESKCLRKEGLVDIC